MFIDAMKRLLKIWLRKQIAKANPLGDWEEIFEWIYNSPIQQWRLKLWCISHSNCVGLRNKELYNWITLHED